MKGLLNGKKLNPWIFWPPFLIFVIASILSIVAFDDFTGAINATFNWVVTNFGWFFTMCAFGAVVLCAVVFFSSAGKIKFGGKDAEPEFRTWEWFAISLTAGIGTGIVFWGVAEPITHFSSPPIGLGIESFSAEAANFAMRTVFLHWTFTPYSLYILFAIPIALAIYNYNQPFKVSSGLYFLIGDRCSGWIGKATDALTIFALAGGVAAVLGAGLLQMGSGLNFLFDIPISTVLWIIIAVIIIASYTISSYTGLDKGIKFLADQNTKIFLGTMVFVFIVGPTTFILDIGTQGFGEFLSNFLNQSFYLSPVAEGSWPTWWTVYFWANWLAFAPIVGLFLVRLTKGRTIREFIAVNLIAPALFGMVWFAVYGGAAIHAQLNGIMDLSASMAEHGLEHAIFSFFQMFPLGGIISVIFLITIAVSFITLADSMTSTLAMVSTRGLEETEEAPLVLKIFWGVFIGVISVVMIVYAGVDGFKMLSNLAGFPIAFLLIGIGASLIKGLYYPDAVWFKKVGKVQKNHNKNEQEL